MRVQILDVSEREDGAGMDVWGRNEAGETVCATVRQTPWHVMLEYPFEGSVKPAEEDVLAIVKAVEDGVRRELKRDGCGRTKCACGQSNGDAMAFSTEPCRSVLKRVYLGGEKEITKRASTSTHFPYKGYFAQKKWFVDVELSEACFGRAARSALQRFCRDEKRPEFEGCEVYESNTDATVAFLDACAKRAGEVGGGAATLAWIEVPDRFAGTGAVPKRTSAKHELECAFSEVRFLDGVAEKLPNQKWVVASFDLETNFEKKEWHPVSAMRTRFLKRGIAPSPPPLESGGGAEIFMVSLAVEERVTVYTWGEDVETPPNVEVVRAGNEKEMLEAFFAGFRAADPDVVTGWNIDSFDWPFLFGRAAVLGVDPDVSRVAKKRVTSWPALRSSSASGAHMVYFYDFPGRVVVDAMVAFKKSFPNLQSYKLGACAQTFLKDDKKDMAYEDICPFWRGTAQQRGTLVEYCAHDAVLPLRLLKRMCVLNKLMSESFVFGSLLKHRVTLGQMALNLRMTERLAYVHGYVIARHVTREVDVSKAKKKRGLEAAAEGTPALWGKFVEDDDGDDGDSDGEEENASKRKTMNVTVVPGWRQYEEQVPGGKDGKGYAGAFVLQPKAGLYLKPVAVLDFQSLYPNIMRAHNLCPTTWVPEIPPGLSEKDVRKGIVGWFLHENVRVGLLPRMLTKLLDARAETRARLKRVETSADEKAMLDEMQKALKVAANAAYGMSGARSGWAYALMVAATVTSMGQKYILATKEYVETKLSCVEPIKGRRYEVVYGDTDSLMIHMHDMNTAEEGLAQLKKVQAEVNGAGLFPAPMQMGAEGVYCPFMMSKQKKNYAAVKYESPGDKGKVCVKGLPVVRREVPEVVRAPMRDVLDAVLVHKRGQNELLRIVQAAAHRMLCGGAKVEDFCISTRLSKEIGSYKDPVPPHVLVARQWVQDDPVHAPTEGDRVTFYLCGVANAKSDAVGPRAFPPHRVRGTPESAAKEDQEALMEVDPLFYFKQKFQNPLRKLLECAGCNDVDIDSVLDARNYTVQRPRLPPATAVDRERLGVLATEKRERGPEQAPDQPMKKLKRQVDITTMFKKA